MSFFGIGGGKQPEFRRILVTGANRGIGLAIVHRCLVEHEDTHVVLACRSAARGDEAVAGLVSENAEWKDRLTVLEMDTASSDSVTAAATTLAEKFGKSPAPLYGIVNNAGIASGTIADVLNVNVRGVKRVDDAFIPLLDPKKGRIVQMSSGAASGCVSRSSAERQAFFIDPKVTWAGIDKVMNEAEAYPNGVKDFEANGIGGSMGGHYGLSKALLCSYTMLVAREHPKLKVNSCSPGFVATDIFGTMLPWWAPVPNMFLRFVAEKAMGAKTPDEGAFSTMHLLFADLVGNGRYYGSDGKRSPLDTYRKPGSPPYEGP